jgi:hypothetical protein
MFNTDYAHVILWYTVRMQDTGVSLKVVKNVKIETYHK